jgi:hypothetical protein
MVAPPVAVRESGLEGEVNLMATGEFPLWQILKQHFVSALDFAFGCHQGKLSRVFTIGGRSYKVCCDCGASFDYSLDTMSIMPGDMPQDKPRHKPFPALRRLCARGIDSQRKFLRGLERS